MRAESAGDAIALGKGALQRKNGKEATASLDFAGDPRVVAGIVLALEDFGVFSGRWRVTKATHKVGGGYTTSVELERLGVTKNVRAVKAAAEPLAKPARPAAAAAGQASDPLQTSGLAMLGSMEKWWIGHEYNEFFRERGAAALNDPVLELVACTPRIARAMADEWQDEDAQGWRMLSCMLARWLDGDAGGWEKTAEPFFVPWSWVASYARVQAAYWQFVTTRESKEGPVIAPIINDAAQEQLIKLLDAEQKLNGGDCDFDFINTTWDKWEDTYYQYKAVYPLHFRTDGLIAALSSFTLRALAAGTVKDLKNGKFKITISRVAVFAHDVFNFDESKLMPDVRDFLGIWNCRELRFSIWATTAGDTALNNRDFNSYRTKTAKGRDFVVVSEPHMVDGFPGKDFIYEKK